MDFAGGRNRKGYRRRERAVHPNPAGEACGADLEPADAEVEKGESPPRFLGIESKQLQRGGFGGSEELTGRTYPTRVVVADDDPIVRELLRTVVLRRQPNIELVGEAVDGVEAIKLIAERKPDILLLDLLMPRLPGMDTLRELASGGVAVRTIVLCASIGKRQIVEALQLGARGVLLKKSLDHLAACMEAVLGGYYWVEDRKVSNTAAIVRQLMSASEAEPLAAQRYKLTHRELQVISLVTLGNSNREIGRVLAISEETVKRHVANIFDKVGTSTRLELAILAIDHHLALF